MSERHLGQDSSNTQAANNPAPSPFREPIDRDGAYRLLYGSATMMKDFLRGFTSEGFTDRLDFSTLRRAETQHVAENLARSANDLVWEVAMKGGENLFVTLMLEFQHRPDWRMAARMALYVSHVILELMRSNARVKQQRRIPQVLPIVLYSGGGAWNAKTDLAGLRRVSANWASPYDLQLKYHLVDVHRSEDLPRALRNVTDGVFRIEREGTVDRALREVEVWHGWLQGRSDEEAARQALVTWVQTILRGRLKYPEAVPVKGLDQLKELLEREMTWVEMERAKAERLAADLRRAQSKVEQARSEVKRARIEGVILGIARARFGEGLASSLARTLPSVRSEETLQSVASWSEGCETGGALVARIQEAVEAERDSGP
ncbi:MAG: Rpn family recombination-promoting nuclease/putative transposase [Bryobacterales bacterium]|nr:Rpn family recombination-promoting nuclease/putative transposase [Bryobacterales bacterium]